MDETFERELDLVTRFGSHKIQLGLAERVSPPTLLFDRVLRAYGSTPKLERKSKAMLYYVPVVMIPEPNLLIHMPTQLREDIPDFAKLIPDKEQFMKQFRTEVSRLYRIV